VDQLSSLFLTCNAEEKKIKTLPFEMLRKMPLQNGSRKVSLISMKDAFTRPILPCGFA
jgi:hypothetical protein